MTYGTTPRRISINSDTAATAPKKFVAKGHDAQLQHAQFNNVRVEVVRMSTDEPLVGHITRRDKFTITLRHERGNAVLESILYKHAIESITLLPGVQ